MDCYVFKVIINQRGCCLLNWFTEMWFWYKSSSKLETGCSEDVFTHAATCRRGLSAVFLIWKLFRVVVDGQKDEVHPPGMKNQLMFSWIKIFVVIQVKPGFLFQESLVNGKYSPFLNGKSHFVLVKFSSLTLYLHFEVLLLLSLYLQHEKALLAINYLTNVLHANIDACGILVSL